MDDLEKKDKIIINLVLLIIYAISFIAYTLFIKDLVKPAGYMEAISFLFKNPGGYIGATIFGIIADIIPIISIILSIAFIISLFTDDDCFEVKDIITIVISIIISVVMIIVNIIFIKYVMLLAICILIIMGAFYLYIKK